MDVVISKDHASSHVINKYQFKILSSLNGSSIAEATQEMRDAIPDASTMERSHEGGGSSKDALIESLMKKADEMSSNVIKMQMRIESIQEEHAKALENARQKGYEEGLNAGIAQEKASVDAMGAKAHDLLSQSIKTLETTALDFSLALDALQKELTHTALEIAKEVIGIETSEHSAKIAAKLSEELIDELKDATHITLRVNPADHGYLSEKIGTLHHIEVCSDRAVSQGGVVAISDVGNIDSEIKKRYERLKRSLLLET